MKIFYGPVLAGNNQRGPDVNLHLQEKLSSLWFIRLGDVDVMLWNDGDDVMLWYDDDEMLWNDGDVMLQNDGDDVILSSDGGVVLR